MFNTNKLKKETVLDRPIFIVDDFLNNPDDLYNHIFSELGGIHKSNNINSLNEIYFIDRRKHIQGDFIKQINCLVKELTNQNPMYEVLATNETLFFDEPYNDPENNWWWAHQDLGYNMIIYMSKDGDSCGTNLYCPEDYRRLLAYGDYEEHTHPWVPKENIKRLKHLEGKYNRMVLFDGNIPHGMNLIKNKFINEYRRNITGFYYG